MQCCYNTVVATAFANLQVDDAIQFRLTSGPACLNTDLHSAGLVGKREGHLGPVKVLGQGLVGKEGAWERHCSHYFTDTAGNGVTSLTRDDMRPNCHSV